MDILTSPFMTEMVNIISHMYDKGWNERNGGNISYLLTPEELAPYVDTSKVLRSFTIAFDMSELIGKYFLVTGSGRYFRNVATHTSQVLGVVRVQSASQLDLLWGLEGDTNPTSELPTHFMSHMARLRVDPLNRVVMHCHATHLISMSFSHDLDENALTKTLWEMCTECIVVFPDGIATIPWIVPGTTAIGDATSAKMATSRLVLWPFHGVYGAGRDIDETYGLIETAEKAAEVYTHMCSQGGKRQTITDAELQELANAFGVVPKAGILKV